MVIDKVLMDSLKVSPRLRMNYNLLTTVNDNSQRMLNAIEPGSIVVPIHSQKQSTETVFIICGKGILYLYDENGKEIDAVLLEANVLCLGISFHVRS